jgi:hypothetical protein
MPNFGYHFARMKGAAIRRAYRHFLPVIAPRRLLPAKSLALDVFSYSGEATMPEQVASIRSFIRNVGRPKRFVVVSDGSHSEGSIALLKRIDPAVSVQQLSDRERPEAPATVESYLSGHPTGKQLALIMSLPEELPALYADSDVLFFPGARAIDLLADAPDASPRYLADCQLSADERLFHTSEEKLRPVNTGVLLLQRQLEWHDSLARFAELDGPPTFFTNQTIAHLAVHQNGGRAFEPAKFVLQLDDQFVYEDRYASSDLFLRHYVNPVRHKFWTSLARSAAKP